MLNPRLCIIVTYEYDCSIITFKKVIYWFYLIYYFKGKWPLYIWIIIYQTITWMGQRRFGGRFPRHRCEHRSSNSKRQSAWGKEETQTEEKKSWNLCTERKEGALCMGEVKRQNIKCVCVHWSSTWRNMLHVWLSSNTQMHWMWQFILLSQSCSRCTSRVFSCTRGLAGKGLLMCINFVLFKINLSF